MAIKQTPRRAVEEIVSAPRLPAGDDERFLGYGAFGVPFSSGHYLALRDFVASSVGPAFRAVWHRDPAGRWTIHTTTAPELSCGRYFGSAITDSVVPEIGVDWLSDWSLEVTVGDRLRWHLDLGRTPLTRLMTGVARLLPYDAWPGDSVLSAVGPPAGALLGTGRLRLEGATPDGPRFRIAPRHVWRVVGGRATVDGVDIGHPAPLDQQTRLGDLWLPQRGLFFVGKTRFTPPASAGRTRPAPAARTGVPS